MSSVPLNIATEKLAIAVEHSTTDDLREIYTELFPTEKAPECPNATDLASHVRHGLSPDEVVDLWHVIFSGDRNVWFNEETNEIFYNEDVLDYAD